MMRSVCFLAIVSGLCVLAGCQHQSPASHRSQETLPAATEAILGTSVQGRPIRAIRFGTASPAMLVMAGIHGDESNGCDAAERLIDFLKACPPPPQGSVVILALANPDGCAAHTRANARGVDLNRNFPATNWRQSRRGAGYGGPAAQSEPETTALIQLIEDLRPRVIISIHSISRGRECNNYDGPAQAVAEAMSRLNHYPAKPAIGYPTPGSLGSWAGTDRQIPMITLELPRSLSGEEAWTANRDALLTAIGVPASRRPE